MPPEKIICRPPALKNYLRLRIKSADDLKVCQEIIGLLSDLYLNLFCLANFLESGDHSKDSILDDFANKGINRNWGVI